MAREWKELCLDLNVPETDLDHLQSSHDDTSLSHLAFLALCMWKEQCGSSATKEALINAVEGIGLRRAAGMFYFDVGFVTRNDRLAQYLIFAATLLNNAY